MQSYSPDAMHKADEDSYCPDYINREKGNKRGKETLEEFCRSVNLPFLSITNWDKLWKLYLN